MKKYPSILFSFLFILTITFTHAQADRALGLHSEGGAWQFYQSEERNSNLLDILLIEDSVMNGYRKFIIDSLENIANVDCWVTPKHLKSESLFADLEQVVSAQEYVVIHFNIGLHGWPEGRIIDEEYIPLMEEYIRVIRNHAQGAKLIWASTTPVTEEDKTVLHSEINPIITQRNQWAEGVMKRNGIAVNDLYGSVKDKLHLSNLDKFHWQAAGYQLMAYQSLGFILKAIKEKTTIDEIGDCNVVWYSPSKNSLGSMPVGNGDVGINLWVEENGDLLFYLSKTDAWSENARLLKLGKVRLSLSPNPFRSGLSFLQELELKEGKIKITAGEGKDKVDIWVWVDAHHPVVEIDIDSKRKIKASISTNPWRRQSRKMTSPVEKHSAYGLRSVTVEKDTILHNDANNIVWAHRNERSIWKSNLSMQGLGEYTDIGKDPLLHNTFGATIYADHLQKVSSTQMQAKDARNHFSISILVLGAQTKTLKNWENRLNAMVDKMQAMSRVKRYNAHIEWWRSFWDRSHVFVTTEDYRDMKKVANISRNYNLQRYMNACAGRGKAPIKFNGSIFTVDTKYLDNRFAGFDADYRQWGGPYWWQNTRLPYWSMLEAGDFDMIQPLFRLYRNILDLRKFATKTYYDHEGAFYLETMRHWGTYAEANYGYDRAESMPLDVSVNTYIRYYLQSGLEFSLLALDYYDFTKDEKVLNGLILPVVTEVITFFDLHWDRDENDKILFDPAMALETYKKAVNPLVEIVGIQKVCEELLDLPESKLSSSQRAQYKRLIYELPAIPMREVNGEKLLAPAYSYSGKQNIENPELYAVFPYRRFMVGKDSIELGRKTFFARESRENRGWQQHSIKAAYLGLSKEAAELMAQNFNAGTSYYRFPTMWGPNYDWTPDQCHGSVAMIALQRMLLQYDRDDIYLFPAWPKDWNVDFKLHAPQNTIVKAIMIDGSIDNLQITPESRNNNIFIKIP